MKPSTKRSLEILAAFGLGILLVVWVGLVTGPNLPVPVEQSFPMDWCGEQLEWAKKSCPNGIAEFYCDPKGKDGNRGKLKVCITCKPGAKEQP